MNLLLLLKHVHKHLWNHFAQSVGSAGGCMRQKDVFHAHGNAQAVLHFPVVLENKTFLLIERGVLWTTHFSV